MRLVVAAIFTLVILSPAGVVFAVVWTTPYLGLSSPPVEAAPTGPVRALPAPDVHTGSLPRAPSTCTPTTFRAWCLVPVQAPAARLRPRQRSGDGGRDRPTDLQVIDHFAVGSIPHHIAPAWDMSTLYVDNEGSSSLTKIDIHTGKPAGTISMPFPYHLYFTPDGTKAIDVVERLQRIEFRDPHHGWRLLALWRFLGPAPIT